MSAIKKRASQNFFYDKDAEKEGLLCRVREGKLVFHHGLGLEQFEAQKVALWDVFCEMCSRYELSNFTFPEFKECESFLRDDNRVAVLKSDEEFLKVKSEAGLALEKLCSPSPLLSWPSELIERINLVEALCDEIEKRGLFLRLVQLEEQKVYFTAQALSSELLESLTQGILSSLVMTQVVDVIVETR